MYEYAENIVMYVCFESDFTGQTFCKLHIYK